MWIRSKYEEIQEYGIMNPPINLSLIESIGVENKGILFNSHDEMYSWAYEDNCQRDDEYNRIMSLLDTGCGTIAEKNSQPDEIEAKRILVEDMHHTEKQADQFIETIKNYAKK